MSLAISIVTEDGIVMASESRRMEVVPGTSSLKFLDDSTPKTFLLDNRICLNYTGLGSLNLRGIDKNNNEHTFSWDIQEEVTKLQEQAAKGADMWELAGALKNTTTKIGDFVSLRNDNNAKYGFTLATYEGAKLTVVHHDYGLETKIDNPEKSASIFLGPYRLYGDTDKGFVSGHIIEGNPLGVISKLLEGEEINYTDMTIDEAIEFAVLTLTAGFTYLKYFERYKDEQNAGGPINVLVMTPNHCGFLDMG